MSAERNLVEDFAEGPFTGADGNARVRLVLDATDRATLVACLRRSAADTRFPGLASWLLDAGLALASARSDVVDMEPNAYFALGIAITNTRIAMLLSSQDASVLAELGERVSAVGAADHPADARASSTREDLPRSFKAEVPAPSDAEIAAAGWKSGEELERAHPGGLQDAYDLSDLNACERLHLNGMCSTFAVALHDATGWEIVAVRDPWNEVPNHFACRTPDGFYADARASDLTERELVAGYGRWAACPPTVAPVERAEVVRKFRRHPANYATAASAVQRLLPDLFEAPAPASAA